MIRFLAIVFACIYLPVYGQFTYTDDQSIPVRIQNQSLLLPFAGGLNAAQFGKIDLNNDNSDDLVIFDRMAAKVITFLVIDGTYEYAPEYEPYFPPAIQNFLLIRDYNEDGKADLFTGDPLGIKVFTNTTTTDGELSWKQFFFTTNSGTKQPVILTQGFTLSNLQLQFDDVPSISDLDGDGDLDILTMRYPSGSTVEFHQNMSQETYGHSDSLKFVRVTQSWGGVRECACGEFAFNGEDCSDSGRGKHAGGKSLLALDADGDGAHDLIISEADCRQLYLLHNTGTSTEALIDNFSLFPSDSSLFPIFPAAFYEDVNFDGKKDLLVSPNIFSREDGFINFARSSSLYMNNNTTESPQLEYVTTSFLQLDMIDVGDNSVPAFADEDGDGDLDLFISSANGFISFFENTGTQDVPRFDLTSEDYFNLRSKGFYNLRIQFSDFDHNGTIDLVFTATGEETGITKLYFISNQSANAMDFSGETEKQVVFTVTFNDNVLATDVNQDGYADLLVGRSDGGLQYWTNNAVNGIPTFALADGEYVTPAPNSFSQYLAAAAADLDADGKPDLVIGDQLGVIEIISDFREEENRAADRITDIIFNSKTNQYGSRNLGGKLWPTIASLNNSDKPSIIVGNTLGGLRVLTNDNGASLPEVPVLDMYPNPVLHSRILNIKIDRPASFYVTNSVGQRMTDIKKLYGSGIHEMNVQQLSAGIYFFHFSTNRGFAVKRLVIY